MFCVWINTICLQTRNQRDAALIHSLTFIYNWVWVFCRYFVYRIFMCWKYASITISSEWITVVLLCVLPEPQLINACPPATLRKQHQQIMNAYTFIVILRKTIPLDYIWLVRTEFKNIIDTVGISLSLFLFLYSFPSLSHRHTPLLLLLMLDEKFPVYFFLFRCLNGNSNCNSLGCWFPVCSRPLIRAHWPPVNLISFSLSRSLARPLSQFCFAIHLL